MAIIQIPADAIEASYSLRTQLDGIDVLLRFEWNDRMERWKISFYTPTDEPLLVGIPMQINLELIERFEIPGLPPGQLLLFDTSEKNLECGRDDLGGRCLLLYNEAATVV